MTSPAPSARPTADCGCTAPTHSTPVLLHRKLPPGTDPARLPLFGDAVWDLTPGLFEAHSAALSLNFATRPAPLREATKHYIVTGRSRGVLVRRWCCT